MTAPLLALRGLTKRHPPRPGEPAREALLNGIDLELLPGAFVAIEGRSGSGKSTLLHLAGGLDPDYGGSLLLDGHELRELSDDARAHLRHRTVGFVFQSFHLLPHLSVLENVLLPAAFGPPDDAPARARAALERVGLAGKEQVQPITLSGGERQRVAIARALVSRPRLILADEPTGHLDAATGAGIIALLAEIRAEGTALLVVTHEVRVSRAADQVLLLREGRLERPSIDPLQSPTEGVS